MIVSQETSYVLRVLLRRLNLELLPLSYNIKLENDLAIIQM